MQTGRMVPTPGSAEEAAATARVVGYPGVKSLTCSEIEYFLCQMLAWQR